MIINFQLTYEDHLALQRNAIKNVKYHRKREKQFLLILTVIVGSIAMYFASVTLTTSLYYESPTLYNSVVVIAGVLSVLILLPIIKKLYIPMIIWQYKSMTKRNAEKKWPINMMLTLNEKGVEVNSERNQVKGRFLIDWEAIQKVGEDENRFYLYFEDNDAVVIPKKWGVTNQEDQDALQKTLKYYLNELF